jgi:hypothetical protein
MRRKIKGVIFLVTAIVLIFGIALVLGCDLSNSVENPVVGKYRHNFSAPYLKGFRVIELNPNGNYVDIQEFHNAYLKIRFEATGKWETHKTQEGQVIYLISETQKITLPDFRGVKVVEAPPYCTMLYYENNSLVSTFGAYAKVE